MSHRGPEGKLGGLSCCVPVAGFSGCGPMALAGFLPPCIPAAWLSLPALGREPHRSFALVF